MPSAKQCIATIKKQLGEKVSDQELDDLATELDAIAQTKKSLPTEKAYMEAMEELAERAAQAGKIQRRNAAINKIREAKLRNWIERAEEVYGDPVMGLRAVLRGDFKLTRRSVDALSSGMFHRWAGGMMSEIDLAGLTHIIKGRHFERDLARELFEVSKTTPGPAKNADARKVAEIIDRYRRIATKELNDRGAWRGRVEGYITRQAHDARMMVKHGKEAWVNDIRQQLDPRTFDGVADPEKFLSDTYDALASGVHKRYDSDSFSDSVFRSDGSLAKRLSQERVLHFKDADAWMDYQSKYGGGRELMDTIIRTFERDGHSGALMEMFGPNPQAMFRNVREWAEKKYRDDPKKVRKLKSPLLDAEWNHLTGVTHVDSNHTFASYSAAVRALQSMASLGMAAISAFADVAIQARHLRAVKGDNVLTAWSRSLTNVMRGAGAQGKTAMNYIHVGMDGMLSSYMTRFSSADQLPGTVSWLQRKFFQINLLGPWTDANKRGMGLIYARDFAEMSHKNFDQLPVSLQNDLRLYEIGAGQWELMRHMVEEVNGNRLMLADLSTKIPDSDIRRVLGAKTDNQVRKARENLGHVLQAYYNDVVDQGVLTPGAREQGLLTYGTQPGTPLGEALRFVMQFKQFPTTVLTKTVGRIKAEKGLASLQMAELIATGTIMGYIAMTAKDYARGKTARDPSLPGTWLSAALQGGALGIYGDILFGEYNRHGRSLSEAAAGPVFSQFSDIASMMNAITREGEVPTKQLVNFAQQNTPTANLFYAQLAWNSLIFNRLQEAANPGALKRMEASAEERGQSYWINQ